MKFLENIMASRKKNKKKNAKDRDSDKNMKALSRAVAKQASVFYKRWFKDADANSLSKVEP